MANYILFGGTFDPVHNGHIRIANAASMKLNADVVFVPARSPRWKNPSSTSNHRVEMLKLALKSAPAGSTIYDYELKSKDEVNYSIDTVKAFKAKHKNDKIYFVIGADQVNQFPRWKDAKELSTIATIIFCSRPGYELNQEIINEYNMLDLAFLESGDVSSSMVRACQSIDIPTDVLFYIEKNRLYFVGKLSKFIPEKRLNHSIEVANLALRVAKTNKLEHPEKYFFTGLLHDIGKTWSGDSENAVQFMKEHYPEDIDLPNFSYHQFIGEYLARTEFGIEDKEMLEAIKCHCTGDANMSKIAMVVYASDKIEPTRGFDSTWLINSCLKDYKQGFIDTLIDNKKYLRNHNKDFENRLTKACFDMYIPEEK